MIKPLLYSLGISASLHVGIASTIAANGRFETAKAASMIEVVQGLEQDGYGPFTEVSMDDGLWEVEVRKQSESVELKVDPVSGKVLSEHRDDPDLAPPADAMLLSKLLKSLSESSGYTTFDEISFERRYWEIEVRRDGQRRELSVDPVTAKIIADRMDD